MLASLRGNDILLINVIVVATSPINYSLILILFFFLFHLLLLLVHIHAGILVLPGLTLGLLKGH